MLQTEVKHTTGKSITADPGLDPEEFQEQFCNMLGMSESMPVSKTIERVIGDLIPNTPENQEPINFLLYHVAAHNPGSLLEAQLLAQMLACHQLCTKMLKKAGEERWPENIDKYTNIAMKLSRGYKTGLETLAKYRRGGKQYLYIERINVEADGQAVIGNISKDV